MRAATDKSPTIALFRETATPEASMIGAVLLVVAVRRYDGIVAQLFFSSAAIGHSR
jgi:hypothetical protein